MRRYIEDTGMITLCGKKYDVAFVKRYIPTHTLDEAKRYFKTDAAHLNYFTKKLGVVCKKTYEETIKMPDGFVHNSEDVREFIHTHNARQICIEFSISSRRELAEISRYLHAWPSKATQTPRNNGKITIRDKEYTREELRSFLEQRTVKQSAAELGISISAVRNHLQRVGAHPIWDLKKSRQLCWECKKATNGSRCPWVRDFKPVPGWTAKRVQLKMDDHYILTFDIKACPLFEADERRDAQ